MSQDLTTILQETTMERTQLGGHRFSQIRTEDPTSLKNYIEKESRNFDFQLPENPFVLYYTLGDADFDEAQLWYPFMNSITYPSNNVRRNLEYNIRLDEIREVSQVLSSRGEGYEVLEVFKHSGEGIKPQERIFALPRFRVYENGEVVNESQLVGKRQYTDNFREIDREERMRRAREQAKNAGGRFARIARKIQ